MSRTLKIYKSYNFRNKDPVIDHLRTAIKDVGMSWGEIEDASGVTQTTLRNWFKGTVRRPQFATVQAVAKSIGYELVMRKRAHMKLTKASVERAAHPTVN